MKSEVLEGTVRREDIKEIKNILQQEKENGNRFVSFLIGAENLFQGEVKGFKSAFAALEHAHEHSTDRDKYIVRSIVVIEKELDTMAGKSKEQDKPLENQREEKRTHGQELSR